MHLISHRLVANKNRIIRPLTLLALVAALAAGLGAMLFAAAPATANGGPHGDYSMLTDACAGCHRSHTAAEANLRSDALQGNAFCQSCHDNVTAPAVATHANRDFGSSVEATFELECTQCHDPHGSKTNLRSIDDSVEPQPGTPAGPVIFTARTGANSFDDGLSAAASRLCVTCHANPANPGYPMASHTGGGNHAGGAFDFSGQDCITCHPHDLDDDAATADGFMPKGGCVVCHSGPQDNGDGLPAGGRRAVTDELGQSSHHVQGQVQDSDCGVCHAEVDTHTDGIVQLKNPDNAAAMLAESAPGAFRAPAGADLANLTTFCQNCHDGDGAAGTLAPFSDGLPAPLVSPHANGDFAGAAEASFELVCAQCHLAHGSSNLAIVNSTLLLDVAASLTAGPVVFTAAVGPDSYDENDAADADDLCAACHTNSNNPGFPMTNHSGGLNHLDGEDYAGRTCTACHPHSLDANAATLDGFAAAGTCIGCHSSAVGSRRAVVGEFASTSHHVQGTLTNNDCLVCHSTQDHRSGQVKLLDADNPANVIELSGNPFADRAEGVKLESFCLACHDADGAAGSAPFSDGTMPAVIDSTAYKATSHGTQATCADCHVNGHGSSNTPILQYQYVTADPNPYTIADYQMCWKCHDPAQIVSSTQRNAFNRLHNLHVSGERSTCAMCHNPHAPTDSGESGLIDFGPAIQRGYNINYINGRTGSAAFEVTATNGTCYIACHGMNHNPETYQRFDIISAAALAGRRLFSLFLPLVTHNAASQPAMTPTPTPAPAPGAHAMHIYLPLMVK